MGLGCGDLLGGPEQPMELGPVGTRCGTQEPPRPRPQQSTKREGQQHVLRGREGCGKCREGEGHSFWARGGDKWLGTVAWEAGELGKTRKVALREGNQRV